MISIVAANINGVGMKIIIAGGGKTGKILADALLNGKTNEVVVIEKDDKRSEELAALTDALVLHGDAADDEMMRDAGAGRSDAVIAVTSDDRTNLIVCEAAKSAGIKTIVARVNDLANESLFHKLGVAAAVNVDTLVAEAFMKALQKPETAVEQVHIPNRPAVFEIMVPDKSHMVGKRLAEIGHGVVVYSIKRHGENLEPVPALKVKAGDVLVLCAPHGNEKKIKAMF